MTRELKLALIVGFSLVLVVTVLISDHLSRARTSTLDDTVSERPALTPPAPTEVADAGPIGGVRPPAGSLTPEPAPDRSAQVPDVMSGVTPAEVDEETPVEITLARGARTRTIDNDSTLAALRREVERLGGRIENGEIHLPPAVRVDPPASAPTGRSASSQPPAPAPVVPGPGGVHPLTRAATREYTVQAGDSAYRIAKREIGNGEDWRLLVDLNPGKITPDGRVRLGQKILVPVRPTTPGATQAGTASRTTQPQNAAPAAGTRPAAPAGTRTYTVQKGDTLGQIASRELKSARRTREIIELNKDVIKNPDMVPVGTVLRLPG